MVHSEKAKALPWGEFMDRPCRRRPTSFAKHFYHDKQSLTDTPDRPQSRMDAPSEFVSVRGFNNTPTNAPGSNH